MVPALRSPLRLSDFDASAPRITPLRRSRLRCHMASQDSDPRGGVVPYLVAVRIFGLRRLRSRTWLRSSGGAHFAFRGFGHHMYALIVRVSTVLLDNSPHIHALFEFRLTVSLVLSDIRSYLQVLVRIYGAWHLRYLSRLYFTLHLSKSIPRVHLSIRARSLSPPGLRD